MSECESDPEPDIGVEVDGRLSAIMPRKLFQDDPAVKSGMLQVFVRMKPVPDTMATCMQLEQNQLLKAVWRNKEAVYKFSKVFQQDAGQNDVYDGTTASLVDDLLQQRQMSAVVMAYGVTNAGKTFTMQGAPDKPGLVPQALAHIFKGLTGGMKVVLSVMEIYNESIHDLLAPAHVRLGKPAALKLKENKLGHIAVQGLSEVVVSSMREAQELLRKAAKARQSSGTNANERSSRSHAVITVKVVKGPACSSRAVDTPGAAAPSDARTAGGLLMHLQACHNQQQQEQQPQLCFVDLAGCERVKRTGNSGARLRESVAINSSLMTLARCLEVLRYNQQHTGDQKVIPYRESKITHLFKDVLHGNGRFVMVVNVSPAAEEFNETKRVLQYAALASKVTMTSEVEHDILVGAEGAWSHATAAGQPPGGAAATSEALAAAEAAAAAARAALSSAQAQIEELLDDKADLEYEVDVVERKVELLREELISAEVEKEQLEAEIRAEVAAEMQEMLDAAAAQHKAAADKAAQDLAAALQEATGLKLQVEQLQQQLQVAEQQAKASICPEVHAKLLQQAREDAASLARQQNHLQMANYVTEIAMLRQKHQQQVESMQQERNQLQQQLAGVKEDHHQQQQQAEAQAAKTAATAAAGAAQLEAIATEAVQMLQEQLSSQQQQHLDVSSQIDMLQAVAQALQAMRQQEQPPQQLPQQQQAVDLADSRAVSDMYQQTASIPAAAAAHVADTMIQQQNTAEQHQQVQQQDQQELPAADHTAQQLQAEPGLACEPVKVSKACGRAGSSRRATLAPTAATAAALLATGGSRRRRQTLAVGSTQATSPTPLAAAVGAVASGKGSIAAAAAALRAGRSRGHQVIVAGDAETAAAAAAAAAAPAVAAATSPTGGPAVGALHVVAEPAVAAWPGKAQLHGDQPSAAAACMKGSRKRRAEQREQEPAHEQQQELQQDPQQQQQHQATGPGRKRARRDNASRSNCQHTVEPAAAEAAGAPVGDAADAAGNAGLSAAAVAVASAAAAAGEDASQGAAAEGTAVQKRQRRKTMAAARKLAKGTQQQQEQEELQLRSAVQLTDDSQEQQEHLKSMGSIHGLQAKLQRQRKGAGSAAAAANAAAVSGGLHALLTLLEEAEEEEEEEEEEAAAASPMQQEEQQQKQCAQQPGKQERLQAKSQQQGQVLMQQAEQWQSAELVLRDVTCQKQLGPVVRGRRATIATMSDAAAAAGSDDSSSGRAKKRVAGCEGGGSAGGVGGVSQKKLQQLVGGVTPVAFRTRHRRH